VIAIKDIYYIQGLYIWVHTTGFLWKSLQHCSLIIPAQYLSESIQQCSSKTTINQVDWVYISNREFIGVVKFLTSKIAAKTNQLQCFVSLIYTIIW